jgi:hypothetical protein
MDWSGFGGQAERRLWGEMMPMLKVFKEATGARLNARNRKSNALPAGTLSRASGMAYI